MYRRRVRTAHRTLGRQGQRLSLRLHGLPTGLLQRLVHQTALGVPIVPQIKFRDAQKGTANPIISRSCESQTDRFCASTDKAASDFCLHLYMMAVWGRRSAGVKVGHAVENHGARKPSSHFASVAQLAPTPSQLRSTVLQSIVHLKFDANYS